jgi:SAM-dependent methyltransferase
MISYWITRTTNGLRKVAAGLKPFSESVWPGVRNDLFVAHESIYGFFETFSRDRRVIDAGCGTGYGAHRLAIAGAKEVIGIDIDVRNVRYASNHYRAPNLRFAVGDIQDLNSQVGQADVIVGSNSLEHLHNPAAFLRRALGVVSEGTVIVAVPPIFTAADASVHADIRYHRSNLSIQQWLSLFAREGWAVQCFAHRGRSRELQINFASPFESQLHESDFVVEKSSPEDLYDRGAITAIFAVRARANKGS